MSIASVPTQAAFEALLSSVSELAARISALENAPAGNVDLSGYYTKAQVDALIAGLDLNEISGAELIHESFDDVEAVISSNVALTEIFTGVEKTFTTTSANQPVFISVEFPFTVHKNSTGASNAAYRLYLDGDAQNLAGGKQWNGTLIAHGSGWQVAQGVPENGMVTASRWITVAEPGLHKLRMQFSGSDTLTIGTRRSRAWWQVWSLR